MRTILVVEDEQHIAELVIEVLSDAGHRVLTATNGMEALMRLEEERPDLIISNVAMPVMDGIELCKKLQADPDLGSIPVLFLSATQTEIDLEDCKYAALIEKPFDMEALLGTVNQTLGEGYGYA